MSTALIGFGAIGQALAEHSPVIGPAAARGDRAAGQGDWADSTTSSLQDAIKA